MSVLVAVAMQRDKVIRDLIDRGALAPESAVAADSLVQDGLGTIRQLKEQGLLKANDEGALYLDMGRLRAEKATHRIAVWILLALAVLAGGVAAALGLAGAF